MCRCQPVQQQQSNAQGAMADGVSFRVPDMSCGHCEKAIRSSLGDRLPGASVDIDLVAKRVTVAVGDNESATAEDAIREAGYSPEPMAA